MYLRQPPTLPTPLAGLFRPRQVLPGYLRARLDPLLSTSADDDADADTTGGDSAAGNANPTDAVRTMPGWGGGQWEARRRRLSLAYRGLCAALDTSHLAHLLLFLSGRSPFASLSQRLLRYRLLPAPTPELSAAGLLPPPGASRRERAAWMLELPLQHARQLLLLSAFGYRLLAWLHAPQNAPPLAAPLVPPPPPPPPLAPGKSAPVFGACAECSLSPIEQPTVAPSGFVFCGRCITSAVRRDGRCPLTGMQAGLPELLRLYETSRLPEA